LFILLGPKRSFLAGLVKFLAVGCGLNAIARGLRQAADTQKRVDSPLIFLISQGKAKSRPGIRYAIIFASPERAKPAVRQSTRACFALSGLWRIGASAYLGRSRTTQGGASLYPGLSHYAPLGRTIRLQIGVDCTLQAIQLWWVIQDGVCPWLYAPTGQRDRGFIERSPMVLCPNGAQGDSPG